MRPIWLIALIMLTQLDGNPIWVESTAVIIVKPSETGPQHQCKPPAKATISVGGRGLCVRETPDEIREKIRNSNGKAK